MKEKEKSISIRKEDNILPLFPIDKIIYMEKPNQHTYFEVSKRG